jgi:hypothetical protein
MSTDNEEYIAHYNAKQQALESILGPSADVIGHAMIPFRVIAGMTIGSVDMHYFPKAMIGTRPTVSVSRPLKGRDRPAVRVKSATIKPLYSPPPRLVR